MRKVQGTTRANDPHGSVEGGTVREVDLAQIAGWLRPRVWLLLGFGLASALLAAVVTLYVLPPSYRASASVVIMRPRATSGLRPQVLPSHAYRSLAESDLVLTSVQETLERKGILEQESQLKIGRNLIVRTVASRRDEDPTAPRILQLEAIADDGAKAAFIANEWTGVFLEHIAAVSNEATLDSIRVIESEFEAAKADLEQAEKAEESQARELDEQYSRLAAELERSMAAAVVRMDQDIERFQIETRRRMEEHAHSLRRDLQGAASDEDRPGLWQNLLGLVSLRQQLAQTPPSWRLEKSISDEALWQRLADEGASMEALRGLQLTTEEVNPLFIELIARVASSEAGARSLGRGDARIHSFLLELERLQRERSGGLIERIGSRSVEVRILAYQRDTELSSFRRRERLKLQQLRRESDRLRELLHGRSSQYGQAVRARTELAVMPDARRVSQATAPAFAEPRFVALRVLVAFLLGSLAGVLILRASSSYAGSSC